MTNEIPSDRDRRGLAAAFALCALAVLALLASHPTDNARTFADMLRAEARDQLLDGLVHGGFIVALSALIVCFVFLSRRLGMARVPITTALVSFAIGSGALMASMVLDGFATPAIAARFVGTDSADGLLMAKTLLILLGTLIRFLMPMGLLFQALAMAAFSWVIVQGRSWRRVVGVAGLVMAACLVVALAGASANLAPHVLLGGILLQSLWYGALAALLFRHELAAVAPEH